MARFEIQNFVMFYFLIIQTHFLPSFNSYVKHEYGF